MVLEFPFDVEILGTWGYNNRIAGRSVHYSQTTLHHGDYETILVHAKIPPQTNEGVEEIGRFEMTYDDLDGVSDGMAAQNAYLEMIDSATDARRRQDLKDQLRAYCRLDTLAMVRMVEMFTNAELSPEPAKR